MSTPSVVQRLAFLDTNTLHYVGIYLEYAKKITCFRWVPKSLR